MKKNENENENEPEKKTLEIDPKTIIAQVMPIVNQYVQMMERMDKKIDWLTRALDQMHNDLVNLKKNK